METSEDAPIPFTGDDYNFANLLVSSSTHSGENAKTIIEKSKIGPFTREFIPFIDIYKETTKAYLDKETNIMSYVIEYLWRMHELNDYYIPEMVILLILLHLPPLIKVNIVTTNCMKELNISINPYNKIIALKKLISNEINVPTKQLRLKYNGILLLETNQIYEYNIMNYCKIQMFVMIINQPHYDTWSSLPFSEQKYISDDDHILIGAPSGKTGYIYCDCCKQKYDKYYDNEEEWKNNPALYATDGYMDC